MEHDHAQHQMSSTPKGYSVKDFVPLIVILIAIIIFTIGAVLWSGRGEVAFVMQMFMAGFFLVFGAFKVVRLRAFVDAYSVYDLITKKFRPYGYAYPFIELSLGVAYLVGWSLVTTNIVTLVVMTVGALGVLNELRKGNQVPCACLGTVFKFPMTFVTLFEDLLMAGMALWMLLL